MTDRFEKAAREIQRQMIKAYDSSFPLAQALRTQWNDALATALALVNNKWEVVIDKPDKEVTFVEIDAGIRALMVN